MSKATHYRFEPTGEVRVPNRGELFWEDFEESLIVSDGLWVSPFPIYRRVEVGAGEDLERECYEAFGRMMSAWSALPSMVGRQCYGQLVYELQQRFIGDPLHPGSGERTREFADEMNAAAQKVNGKGVPTA